MTLTPEEYAALAYGDPIEGATVVYFAVQSAQVGEYYIQEHRLVYYGERVKWADHPWGQNDGDRPPGADFVDHWTHESTSHFSPYPESNGRWSAEGRSSQGFSALLLWLKPKTVFATYDEAMVELRERIDKAVERAEDALFALNGQIKTLNDLKEQTK